MSDTERETIAAYASALDSATADEQAARYKAFIRGTVAYYRAWLASRGETDDSLCQHTDEERELIDLVRAEQARRDVTGPTDDMEEPAACPCGHAWTDHVAVAGCMVATDWWDGGHVFCACPAEPLADEARP